MAELVVNSAVEYIGSLIREESNKADLSGVESEAIAVQSELESIKNLVTEIRLHNNEVRNKEPVRTILDKVIKMAYEAEDVVDTYVSETESSRNLTLGFNKLYRAHQTTKELRKLRSAMKETKRSMADSMEDSVKGVRIRGSESPKCHIQSDEEYVVGIDFDIEKLVKILTDEKDHQKDCVDVLAIVGMGGSGKTTLARNIYNHAKIKKYFKYQAWVSMSRGWVLSDVMSEISRQTNDQTGLFGGLSEFLLNGVRRKKSLIVLDNVWDCDRLQDELLPKIIQRDDGGDSNDERIKIVITSRHRHEHDTTLKWCFHEMNLLRQEDALDLLNKISIGDDEDEDEDRAKEYRGLALSMLNKCGGLPLAIVALAKLLKKKDTIQDWEIVFAQLTYKEGPNDLYLPINEILAISYHDLPQHLRPCFLYFGLFPQDFSIKVGSLMKMWIAEGFVQNQHKDGETSEGAARRILQELIDQTMVQVVKKTYYGKVKTLRVHDIMRDLCIKEAHKLEFLTVLSSEYVEHNEMARINSRRTAINLREMGDGEWGNAIP